MEEHISREEAKATLEELTRINDEERVLVVSIALRKFTKSILHGDEAHQLWLLKACEDFIAGRPVQQQNADRPAPPTDERSQPL